MSRFTVTLTDEINEKLQQLATEEGKTLSAVISEALELKFKIHDMNDQPKNEATKKMEELALKVPVLPAEQKRVNMAQFTGNGHLF